MMRGRLDRPVTEQERELTRNPFNGWGGYVEATSDPRSRYYTKANIHNDYLVDRQLVRAVTHAERERDDVRDLAYYEAVPYLRVVESVDRGGQWLRRAEYPELPGRFAAPEYPVGRIVSLTCNCYATVSLAS